MEPSFADPNFSGNFTECNATFTEWSDCSATCGEGKQSRTFVGPGNGACDYEDGFVQVNFI